MREECGSRTISVAAAFKRRKMDFRKTNEKRITVVHSVGNEGMNNRRVEEETEHRIL